MLSGMLVRHCPLATFDTLQRDSYRMHRHLLCPADLGRTSLTAAVCLLAIQGWTDTVYA